MLRGVLINASRAAPSRAFALDRDARRDVHLGDRRAADDRVDDVEAVGEAQAVLGGESRRMPFSRSVGVGMNQRPLAKTFMPTRAMPSFTAAGSAPRRTNAQWRSVALSGRSTESKRAVSIAAFITFGSSWPVTPTNFASPSSFARRSASRTPRRGRARPRVRRRRARSGSGSCPRASVWRRLRLASSSRRARRALALERLRREEHVVAAAGEADAHAALAGPREIGRRRVEVRAARRRGARRTIAAPSASVETAADVEAAEPEDGHLSRRSCRTGASASRASGRARRRHSNPARRRHRRRSRGPGDRDVRSPERFHPGRARSSTPPSRTGIPSYAEEATRDRGAGGGRSPSRGGSRGVGAQVASRRAPSRARWGRSDPDRHGPTARDTGLQPVGRGPAQPDGRGDRGVGRGQSTRRNVT